LGVVGDLAYAQHPSSMSVVKVSNTDSREQDRSSA
jgi:hypothetical protein